jgi:hypothetical protein
MKPTVDLDSVLGRRWCSEALVTVGFLLQLDQLAEAELLLAKRRSAVTLESLEAVALESLFLS